MARSDPDNLDAAEDARRAVVTAAEAVLRGEVGVIAGARQLSLLSHEVVPNWVADPDFHILGALDSETDHLPIGPQRALWDPAALAERDAAVARIEADARSEVEAACRNLVARFAAG